MGFLDWIKRGKSKPEPEPVESRHHTAKGDSIMPQWTSEWRSGHDGLHEFRHHVGRSVEGFHGGLEVSFRGGDHSFGWSNKRPNAASAERASYRMRDAWERGDQPSERAIESVGKQLAEWRQDYAMAKERDSTGKEPECRPIPRSAQPKPKLTTTKQQRPPSWER